MIYQVYVGALTLLIFNVQQGNGVMCYSCSSKANETCTNPYRNSLRKINCSMNALEETKLNAMELQDSYGRIFAVDRVDTPGTVSLSCLKLVVKDGNKHYILRGCQLAEQLNLDICRKLAEPKIGVVKMVHCSKCNIDFCNSSLLSFNVNFSLVLICVAICNVFYKL